MAETSPQIDIENALSRLDEAAENQHLSEGAQKNIRIWLTKPEYSTYREMVVDHLERGRWRELDDAFWTVIPFGTGGRRGRMYPIGSNAINDRTIGESAQGLANYVKQSNPQGPWRCAIGYDTRHRSREFAELCAGVMVASGFQVFFIDDYRSTPELSFVIRYKSCDCGIMVTASHNPPSDNAVKVYWSTGGQLVPPHDKAVIEQVRQVGEFDVANFEAAKKSGMIECCTAEADAALLREHLKQSLCDERDLKIIFSPLHGVGEFNVKSLLEAVGFPQVDIYGPHRAPDGDFPNVPDHVSNPENPQVFEAIIEYARQSGAELILASDPDCDRMGVAAPVSSDSGDNWATLSGNQIASLLADYVLGQRKANKLAHVDDYVVTTLVTTLMTWRIAKWYGVACHNNNLVGFKWIADVIDREGPERFAFGAEESHGYLVGSYARDKDGAVACLLMAELAAKCKAEGISVHQKLDDLFDRHGYHAERLCTVRMEGSDGMRQMQQLMDRLRQGGLISLDGMSVTALRDHRDLKKRTIDGSVEQLVGPKDNLIILETEVDGNYIAVRPSGTEPKVKMYLFAFVPPVQIIDLAKTKEQMDRRLDGFERDLAAYCA